MGDTLRMRITAILLLLWVSIAPDAISKGVSSPDQLGPYTFESYIDSRQGSITADSEVNNEGTAVLVQDPVIDERLVDGGIFAVGNAMTADGPLAWMNFDLFYVSDDAIGSSFMTIGSEVSYDLAVLGSTIGPASVRVSGSSFAGGSGRPILGMPTIARARVTSDVYIFDTDAGGNADNLVWSGDLDTLVSLETNTLYKVVLYIETMIDLSSIKAFQLSGYRMIGPISLQSETENTTAIISEFNGPLQLSQPLLDALRTDGEDSRAQFSGGVNLSDQDTFKEDFQVGDSIRIVSEFTPEPSHIGMDAEIFVVVSTGSEFIQITATGLRGFDGSLSDLSPFSQATLNGTNELDLLSILGGQVTLDASLIGDYEFFIGYTVDGGTVTYSASPIRLNIR